VTGGWRKLHNEELHNLYYLASIIGMIESKRMRWGGNVACMCEKRTAYSIFMRKPEGKRPLGRTRLKWEYNIKMHLRVIGWGDVDCIDLAQDRGRWMALLNMVMDPLVP
jgi:hypothetical protein